MAPLKKISATMLQILSTDSASGCKCDAETLPAVPWQHSESISTSLAIGDQSACKRARYSDTKEDARVTSPALEKAPDRSSRNPLDALGADIFQSHILPLLDPRTLARCASVCSQWRAGALSDKLWQPHVESFLSQRAHFPLCLIGRDVGRKHLVFSIAMTESLQRTLLPSEMCGRTWEIRLKPSVGPYWLSFDPSQSGKRGLNRYFGCDGSTSSDPGDPIWGGHSCVWEFVRVKGHDGELVQINHWPPLLPHRTEDGRWVMENFYGLYITRADNPAFSGCDPEVKSRVCENSCKPPTFGFNI